MESTTANKIERDARLLKYDRLVFAILMLHLPVVMFLVPISYDTSAFAITASGRPLIAVFQFQAGLIIPSGKSLPIAAINRQPQEGGLTFYNAFSQGWRDSVHAAVGFQLQSLGKRSVVNDTVAARVLQVRRRAWSLRLQENQWLVAAGANHLQAEQIAPGDTVFLYCHLPPARQRRWCRR